MAELDPNGKSPHESGAKLDAGKLDFEIVFEYFATALEAVAVVAMSGELKYTRGGWRNVPNGLLRYRNAAHRHDLKRAKGETYDKDSKLHHVAHKAWNALAELELVLAQEALEAPATPAAEPETKWATAEGHYPGLNRTCREAFISLVRIVPPPAFPRGLLSPGTWFPYNRKK